MILEILKYPNPILNEKCKECKKITKDLVEFSKDLIDTLDESGGLGLSAPQVGRSIRILVMKKAGKTILMFNPVIVSKSNTKRSGNEGCLSFEVGEEYCVKRPTWVKVRYKNVNGNLNLLHLTDLDARVFLHEQDHLQGVTMEISGVKVEKE